MSFTYARRSDIIHLHLAGYNKKRLSVTADLGRKEGFCMKKFLSLALVLTLLCALALSVNAYDQIFLECEDGVITGAATLKDNNNIQDVGDFASGGLIVGLSGDNSDMTLASTVTFENVSFPEDGTYRITLQYDTTNDTHKGVDLLVDGARYEFYIDEAKLPDTWAVQMNQTYLDVIVLAGTHNIAVTTPLDFNRDSSDPDTYVKSVNADYITIDFLEALPTAEEPAAEAPSVEASTAEAPAETAPSVSAPQTFDPAAITVLFAVLAGAGAFMSSKKRGSR